MQRLNWCSSIISATLRGSVLCKLEREVIDTNYLSNFKDYLLNLDELCSSVHSLKKIPINAYSHALKLLLAHKDF